MEIQEVYNNISNEFDSTRHSVWKAVREFLDTLQPKSKLAEIGCGNGKNMLYRSDLDCEGIDFSEHLVEICQQKNIKVHVGNILHIPYEDGRFDNVICIAVIHHLETQYERVEAINELLRITKMGGKILVSVWAKDQEPTSKRIFQSNNVYVPFHGKNGSVYNRFYHVYNKGDLEYDLGFVNDYKFAVEKIFYEKSNWYVILVKE